MQNNVDIANLQVGDELYDLINNYICPSVQVDPSHFWQGLSKLFADFTPRNQALLKKRVDLQQQIDDWYHQQDPYARKDDDAQKAFEFLKSIGYLVEEGDDFQIETSGVDDDIAKIPGPQLVVPINNARYALNAANARWGSLFDSLYGSNVISQEGHLSAGQSFNQQRAKAVIDYAFNFLDDCFPLQQGSFAEIVSFGIVDQQLEIELKDGATTRLNDADQFVGFKGSTENPAVVLLKHHQLHVQLCFDENSAAAALNLAKISDIICESAITTIQDCEDSVAAVDAVDKALVYKNWFLLMQGQLTETFWKNNQQMTRFLNEDLTFTNPQGEAFKLRGKCTLFVRNVGHLMTTPAVLDAHGNELPEGILDASVTALAALNDLRQEPGCYGNTKHGSMYIVKPKMHGPEEVAFTNDLFAAVEDLLELPRFTIKVGIMDEERRTTLNLKECIRAAKNRVVFINTGFLDRTGDEIHTSMHAGVFMRKADQKNSTWLNAYEQQNVQIGLQCGFQGKAQIGKGMWAIPDDLNSMMQSKLAHPKTGANTAWVPSPTAATLHALHYHQTDVWQNQLHAQQLNPINTLDLLELPLANPKNWRAEEIQAELDNNCQGLLGYTVKWIDAGIGCSKVADIHNVGLMEDRATVRISSQLIANWLHHGVISEQQVEQTLRNMAAVVDQQNSHDSNYEPMADNFEGLAFEAARRLIYDGVKIANGYTEPTLHRYRLDKKVASV